MSRMLHLLGGQMIMNARPTTAFSGMVPPPGKPSWPRESYEISR